ncbi:hypothetical protein AcV7_008216 [Taiwanofungus camphoratus]|nr:hypothetical protein AcW2_006495 [Antrodia cinnamomea]KAI0952393.1 hypothetical protein AcV7_008216 [Antrodia cinnamomea]
MTTLPSFVELMASLGLDNQAGPVDLRSHSGPVGFRTRAHHSRSSSYSSSGSFPSPISSTASLPRPDSRADTSPAIMISGDEMSSDRDWDADRRRIRTTRYSPYAPLISHTRKGSVPIMKEEIQERPARALSTSPYLSPATCTISRRTSSYTLKDTSRRPEKLTLSETDLTANMPISTFVRRKTPSTSPTSPTFPHRKKRRSTSPSLPVCIPTLPHVFPASPTSRYCNSDTEDEEMPDVSTAPMDRANRPRPRTIDNAVLRSRCGSPGVSVLAFARPHQQHPHVSPLA